MRVIDECQICYNKNLESILFLGYVPPVNSMHDICEPAHEEQSFPLELKRCNACSLVQIGFEVSPEVLFPPSYPYLSASTKILRQNFADLCDESTKLLDLKPSDLIVDIGSNDGTLLSNFKNAGFKVLGIEPTNAARIANQNGIDSIQAFFDSSISERVLREFGQARIVTAANVFAHIKDVHSVVESICNLIGDNGVFISESHYLLPLIRDLQYDTIYHEHLRYYSLQSLSNLFNKHGLKIVHAKPIPTHGGSIRVYAAKSGDASPDLAALHGAESAMGLADSRVFHEFKTRVMQSKVGLYKLISNLPKNSRIYGIGAPSRASTLISYTGLGNDIMPFIVEIPTSKKLNKFMPGTRIPVLDESYLITDQPEYALLLSWHIHDELVVNLRKKGYKGKFITPLPVPQVLNA